MIKNTTPSIWTGMYAEHPLHEALAVLADQGWRAFEVSCEHMDDMVASDQREELVALALGTCDELGLTLDQGHGKLMANVAGADVAKREADLATLDEQIALAGDLGLKCLVIHPGCRVYPTTRDEFKTMIDLNVEAFRKLGDRAGEHGVRIGLENLPRTSAFDTSAKLLDLIDAIDHPAMGINFDTSHANISPGIDAAAAIRDFGDLLVGTHLSDNDGSGDQHKTPGNGTINWAAIMQALSDVDYAGVINLEIPGERHRVLGLRDLKSRYALRVSQWLISSVNGS